MPLKLGIPKETSKGERRVSIDPTVLSELNTMGIKVFIEKSAGESAFFSDSVYNEAIIVDDLKELSEKADIIWRVKPPSSEEVGQMRAGSVLIGTLNAHDNIGMLKPLADKKLTSFSMELIPSLPKSQTMDSVSSQASISGYKAAIMAADLSPKFFPMLSTSAGMVRPAKVAVIGADVAGLQAIATAKRLGAIVEAYDVRPKAKQQIESLGATAIDIDIPYSPSGEESELTANEREQQQAALADHIAHADVLITSVLSHGKSAPKIIPQSTVNRMKAGSVIIDLVAEQGGNCTLTKSGEVVMHDGVAIHGLENVPSKMPTHASRMYARNLFNFMMLLVNEQGDYEPNFENEIVLGALLTKDGEVMHEGTLELLNKTLGEK